MRIWPLLLAALCLSACGVEEGPYYGYDPSGEECINNSPPAIGNLEMNSQFDNDEVRWLFSLHFDWADPGIQGASDPPNLVGGYFSSELFGYASEDIVFTAGLLQAACGALDPETGASGCIGLGHSLNGCPSGGVLSCTEGEFTVPYISLDGPLEEDQEIEIEFRIRDACGPVGTASD